MGEILYSDRFNPQRHENPKPPYQNFTFTIQGTNTSVGKAYLHATQTFLIGVGGVLYLE